MPQKLLTPDHFRKPFYRDRLKAETQIGRILNDALNDFRKNKLCPHLPALRSTVTSISLAFSSLDISVSSRVIKGVNLDEIPVQQVSKWADNHRYKPGFADVCETIAWAWPHISDVIREGLAIREVAKNQSDLLDVSRDVLAKSGLLIVDEHTSDRSYGYHYEVTETSDRQIELSEELGYNFPRMKGGDGVYVEECNPCFEEGCLWGSAPDVRNLKELRDRILRVAPRSNRSVFHFRCSMPFPLKETLLPIAQEELQRYLQGNLGQKNIF